MTTGLRPDNLMHVTRDAHESWQVVPNSLLLAGWELSNMDFYRPSAWRENPEQVLGDISVADRDDTNNDCEVGYILSKDY